MKLNPFYLLIASFFTSSLIAETQTNASNLEQNIYAELAKISSGDPDYLLLASAYEYGYYVEKNMRMAIHYYTKASEDDEQAKRELLRIYTLPQTTDSETALNLINDLENAEEQNLIGLRLYHQIRTGDPLTLEYIQHRIHGKPTNDPYIHMALGQWYWSKKQLSQAKKHFETANRLGVDLTVLIEQVNRQLWSPTLFGHVVSDSDAHTLLNSFEESALYDLVETEIERPEVVVFKGAERAPYQAVIFEQTSDKTAIKGLQLVFRDVQEFGRAYQSIMAKHGYPNWQVRNNLDFLTWGQGGFYTAMTVPKNGISCKHIQNVRSLPRKQRLLLREDRCITLSQTKSDNLYIQYNFPVASNNATIGADYEVHY